MKNRFILATLLATCLNRGSTTIVPEDIPLFEQAVRSPYYVDKTPLVKKFVRGDFFQQITSPKGFGKSTTLDMARRFLQIPLDEKGNVIDRKSTYYYKLFNNESLNLEVAKDKNFTEDFFGKYPLLYFNFAYVKGSTSKEVISSIKEKIAHSLKPYMFLYHKAKHNYEAFKHEKDGLEVKYWDTMFSKSTYPTNYGIALRNVTAIIKNHFDKEVLLFVVHYDVPYLCTIDKEDVWAVNSFMYTLFNYYIITRGYVAKPVIFVGISRVFIRGILGEFCDMFDDSYFQDNSGMGEYYFALTEHQVNRSLEINKVGEHDRKKLKKYYNGYDSKKLLETFGRTAEDKPLLYNTKGVMQFLETKTYKDDIIDPLLPKLMRCLRNEKFFHDITRILMRQTTLLDIDFHIFGSDVKDLIDVVHNDCIGAKWSRYTPHMAHFIDNGYLTYGFWQRKYYLLANQIAENKLRKEYERFFKNMYNINITNPDLTACLEPILNSNITTNESLTSFINTLQKYLQPMLTPNLTEFQYQSLVFAGIYRNWDFSKENVIVTIYPALFDAIPDEIDVLVLPNVERTILTIIKIAFKGSVGQIAFEAREYVPFDAPKETTIRLVKYVGVNLNQDLKVEAQADRSRTDWVIPNTYH